MSIIEKAAAERGLLEEHDLAFLGGVPVVYHCHHFNLFLDQTVEDALGTEEATTLRFHAAREASSTLLATLCKAVGAETPAERLELARGLFAAMGHGRLDVSTSREGGEAHGEYLHYGFAWQEKYGHTVRRRHPADHFAAGYAAAATEVAFGLPRESISARETSCIATRDKRCSFTLAPGEPGTELPQVGRAETQKGVRPAFGGQNEDTITKIAAGLRDFAAGVHGDERGLVQAFGVFVTLHLASYYNRISYDALRRLEQKAPQSTGVLEELLRESGHVCVFNTFGGILLSPEWESMVGPLKGDVDEIVTGCCAIGRALGFGHWTIAELDPTKKLVVRTPSTYESVYWQLRNPPAESGRCYFLQGAALAMMQLANRVKWADRPTLNHDFYVELFRKGSAWRVEETRCISKGDDQCEVVVTAT